MSFTIQRILGIAAAMTFGLFLLAPAPGLAQATRADLVVPLPDLVLPDLVVTAIGDPPAKVAQGHSFPARYTVQNTGVVSASRPSLVKFALVPIVGVPGERIDLKGASVVPVLPAGGPSFTDGLVALTVRPETVPGTYHLEGCADSGQTEPEADEDNNCKESVGTVQVTPMPVVKMSFFLRGTGATANPATLILGTFPPLATVPKTRDAGTLRFAGGNTWKEVGTWQAALDEAGPFGTFVMALEPLRVWLGLLNSDDQGTKFDLKVEMFKNNIVMPIAEGMLRCVAGLTRDPNKAAEVVLPPVLVSPQLFNGTTDVLHLELSARIGTNGDDTRCAGSHASAMGLRAYFDAVRRDARFDAVLSDGNEAIGEISEDIARASAPSGESPMGDLVADAHLSATRLAGAQIALINPGGLRADLTFAGGPGSEGDGVVTYAEAFRVLPFGERLVTMTLTGAQIKDVLEQQFPGFLGQTVQRILGVSAGVTYTWSGSAPLGAKLSNLALNGVPIDLAASYRVTVNGFLARGGDGFSTLTDGSNRVTSSGSDLDALIHYLGANAPVTPPPLNRIARDA